MNTQTKTEYPSIKVPTYEALHVLEIGRKMHAQFKIVGYGPVPKKHYFQGMHWYMDPIFDESEIPPQAKPFIDRLKSERAKIAGIVIAHEKVWQVAETTDSTTDLKVTEEAKAILPKETGDGIADFLKGALELLLKVVGFMALSVVAGPLVLIDPIAIVILDDEDQTWIEVCHWWEE